MTTADAAIRVEGVGKRYRLGEAQTRFPTLRDALTSAVRRAGSIAFSPLRSFRERARPETFWALRDVSFEVARGEVVGIIGGNGAGKSTLLKVLSRITEPTEGRVEIHGRVGSLLEVGTGFHPELTGRENTFLNGAILGMARREIARKFDEIVAFAEVERFIDTPVKHYSSGMYLRLAFAVAAHLEPEILIVDEVLAVGDAGFQRKCLGKMDDVARQGRTVLFVSHNMDAIHRLCTRSIMLERGRVVAEGPTAAVVSRYLSRSPGNDGPRGTIDISGASRTGSGEVRFRSARYSGASAATGFHPSPGGSLEIKLEVWSNAERSVESFAVSIRTLTGVKLLNADVVALGRPVTLSPGSNTVIVQIDALHLNPGTYVVGLWAGDALAQTFDHLEEAFHIEVVASYERGLGLTPKSNGVVPCDFDVRTVAARDARAHSSEAQKFEASE
jgi:ABC-type polysaccharide/polyol phosphate transport system ATPase subunit